MAISNIQLNNTFNEFRQAFNDAANTITALTDGGNGSIVTNTITANTITSNGNLIVSGNLTILGSNTELSTTQININDPLLQLANNNTSDLVDIGVFGQYNSGAANLHSGIFRDATDGTWKLFKSYSTEPTTTIDPTANNFAYADLNVNSLTANSYVYLNNQNVLRFGSANANYVGLKSSSVVNTNITWTLPSADGISGQALSTNGSGILSWSDVSSTVANGCIYLNSLTISSNYTIAPSQGAHSVGPITVASGVTLTVSSGSRYVIA